MYKRPFYQIVESNRIEKSIRQRESNRIESNFPPMQNALEVPEKIGYNFLLVLYSNFVRKPHGFEIFDL